MAKRSRVRRILKWTGLIATLLILGLWAVSLRWIGMWVGQGITARVHRGEVVYMRTYEDLGPRGWAWERCSHRVGESLLAWPTVQRYPETADVVVTVTLWLPLLVIAIPTAWLFYRDRKRIPPGHCLKCGYDLTGNTSGVCPECGAACDSTGQGK